MTDPRLDRIPSDPRMRHIWIKAELEVRNLSFSDLARGLEVAPQYVRAATSQNLRRPQEAIAKALGLPVERLFPEYFDAKGRRLGRKKQCDHNSARICERNVEGRRIA